MSVEIKVSMKTKEKSLSQKYLVKEGTRLDIFDEEIQRCINDCAKQFGECAPIAKVKITINLEL